jgi:hypothetical protein
MIKHMIESKTFLSMEQMNPKFTLLYYLDRGMPVKKHTEYVWWGFESLSAIFNIVVRGVGPTVMYGP